MTSAPAFFYEDGTDYEVELHDHVEATIDGRLFDGQVTAIYRTGMVRVRYLDHDDIAKRTGEPKKKTARVSYRALSLERRDG